MQKTVIDDLKKVFNSEKDKLIKLNQDDNSSNFELDTNKFSNIIDSFLSYNKEELKMKEYLFYTNGNPYTTLITYLYSMINEVNISIDINSECMALNHEIENIMNNFMKKNWYKNKVKIIDSFNVKDLHQYLKDHSINYVYVFDNRAKFNELEKMGVKTVFQPLFTIDLYTDSENYRFLENMLENYCEMNLININIYENKSIQFIYQNALKKGSASGILILTDKFADAEKVKENITDKKVYINFNPFDIFETDMTKSFLA